RACEARLADRARLAERLGELDVGRRLGEPQLRVVDPTGHLDRDGLVDVLHETVEQGRELHGEHLLELLAGGVTTRRGTACRGVSRGRWRREPTPVVRGDQEGSGP